ncbi:hypothetical protein BGX24_004137 [Mortierella sp. AD032]|nr:hypothetical protein BGX24_004137 [Mortierella sp. AD032]
MHAKGEDVTTQMLNDNVVAWLNLSSIINSDGKVIPAGINDKFKKCLEAPNYTVFSNTTSAQRWNDDRLSDADFQPIVPLEPPHNSMHLAVGGFDLPGLGNVDQVAGANGDMGENDTAAFAIFFFHHCFIDFMFWTWQVEHDQRDSLAIIQGYPGTNSVDSQGPTPGVAGGTWLTLDSPLDPFKSLNDPTRAITSNEVVNIVNLGYTYIHSTPLENFPSQPGPILVVDDIDRSTHSGSFVNSVWAKSKNGEEILVGTEAVLSRWHVSGCQNCQNHLEVWAHIPMERWSKEQAENMEFEVRLQTRKPIRGIGGADGPRQGVKKPTIRLCTAHL